MFKCGLMVMVVTGLIVCPHHTIITLVYTTITAHHVTTHRALTISSSTLSQCLLVSI